jgi:hypothetical protein
VGRIVAILAAGVALLVAAAPAAADPVDTTPPLGGLTRSRDRGGARFLSSCS